LYSQDGSSERGARFATYHLLDPIIRANADCVVKYNVKYKHNSVWRAAVIVRSLIRPSSIALSRERSGVSGQVVLSHTYFSVNKHIGQRAVIFCGWEGISRLDG